MMQNRTSFKNVTEVKPLGNKSYKIQSMGTERERKLDYKIQDLLALSV